MSSAHPVVISEIHYHAPPGAAETEFVELYNAGSIPLDMTGFAFTEGIRYEFPEGTVFEPGSYIVVAEQPDAIESRYGVDAFGPFEGRLDNDGDRLTLLREGGGVVVTLRYGDADPWSELPDGFGPSLSLLSPYKNLQLPESWRPSLFPGGTPGKANGFTAETFDTLLVRTGTEWRYFKGTEEPPASWNETGFDDSIWPAGPGGFGYGDDDDATELADMRNSYLSVYIRTSFQLSDPPPEKLLLRVRFDDSFAAWIDGVPVVRSGLGDGVVPFDQPADTPHEATGDEEYDISAYLAALAPGAHVLAMQGHNVAINSSDFSLNAELVAREVIEPDDSAVSCVLNEIKPSGLSGGWVELYNCGTKEEDLSEMVIRAGRAAASPAFSIPEGTVVAAGGFLVFDEEALGFSLTAENEEEGLVLMLIQADRSRVSDAHTIRRQVSDGLSVGRYPDGAAQWWCLDAPAYGVPNQAASDGGVVINEIMYHPLSTADPLNPQAEDPDELEYIELYNHGASAVDMSGWYFSDGITYVLPEGTFLEPGAYMVVARTPERIAAVYNLPHVLGPYEGVLANDGELLCLADARGNRVDEVRYFDGGEWSERADGNGSSLELVDPRSDNAQAGAWRGSDETRKAPWTYVEYSSPLTGEESEMQLWLLGEGRVLIDDVRVVSSGVEYLNEDFETGGAGWAFRGTHQDSWVTMDEAYGGSAALCIEAAGRGEQRWNYVEVDTTRAVTSGRTYTVSYWGRWMSGMPVVLSRQHGHGLARSVQLTIPEALGTPGRENSCMQANAGPVISDLVQSPVMPSSSEQVSVCVRAVDPDDIAAVTLLYRDQRAGDYERLLLHDDGAHGDMRAHDGIFGGAVPPFAHRVRVMFRIEATDMKGETSKYPAAGPCLYLVNDAPPEGDVAPLHLITTDQTYQELASRPIMSNYLLPASVVFGREEIYHNVGFRYRGSPFIRPQAPSGHRIRFPDDHPFLGSLSHVNLDSQRQDGSLQRERTVFYLLRKLGMTRADSRMPYSLDDYVTLWHNGSRIALYEYVERVDGDYVQAWWRHDDNGYLLKVNVQTEFRDDGSFSLRDLADLNYRGEDEERYRLLYNMFSHEKRDDFTPLIDLCHMIQLENGTGLEEGVRDQVFIRQWADQIAVRLYVADWDTFGVVNGHNIYLYYPVVSRRWEIIPWDADLTFSDVNAQTTIGSRFPALRKVFARPCFDRMLRSAYRRLIDDVIETRGVADELDRVYSVLATEGAASPQGIVSFLSSRAAVVGSQIPSGTFRITTNGGDDFTADATEVHIAGAAPIEVEYITLNGTPVDDRLTWTSFQSWRISCELTEPVTEFRFDAYDYKNQVVGSAVITITAPPLPLALHSIDPVEGSVHGGTSVTLKGTGFEEGAFVTFIGVVAWDVTVVSSTTITATTPPSPIGSYVADVRVINPDGKGSSLLEAFAYIERVYFIRGDANRDSMLNIADAVAILSYLFGGGFLPCHDAADVNDDGNIDISDPIGVLSYLFGSGAAIPPPFPEPGEDATEDRLSCDQ